MRLDPIRRRSWLVLVWVALLGPTVSAQGFRPLIDHVHLAAQPSQGSAIDHAFSVANLDTVMTALQSEGAKIAQPIRDVPGLFKLAFIEDPWGTSIEIVQDRIDGIDMSGVWILFQRGEAVPSQGHSIDHIGFRPVNVDASVAELKTRNVKITTEPRPLTFANGTTVRLAFAEGPDGVRIELVQRPE